MRKFISIPVVVLILFTGITFNIASHYCGGKLISTKISLARELATCGMEQTTHEKPGINEANHVCQDFLSAFTFSNNYIPSAIKVIDNHQWYHVTGLTASLITCHEPQHLSSNAVVRPPGDYCPGEVETAVICIFRI